MKILPSAFRSFCKYCSKINSRFFYEKAFQKDSTVVNQETIKNHLQTLSVPFKEGYTCFHVKKCFCGPAKKSVGATEIFINKRTGFFMCELCKVTADWDVCSHLFAKPNVEKGDLDLFEKQSSRYNKDAAEWEEVVEETESLEYLTDKSCCDVLKSFNLNPFPRYVLEKLGIRVNNCRNVLYFPLYHSTCVVGYKAYHLNGEEDVFPRMNCPGLLKSLKSSYSDTAVVVANIPDFLALMSVNLTGYEVICLPYGALYVSQNSLPYFERFHKIILWLGQKCLDVTGNIAVKFHEKRCYIVKPNKESISASVAVLNNQDIKQILNEAKLGYHEFVTTFSSFREAVLAEVQNETQIVGIPWTKFPSLTKILKGHRRGELTILTGPTGIGKTTFLSEYSLDLAAQGVYTLWGSFELKNIRLAKIMLTQYAGAPLPQTLGEFNEICDKFEHLPIFFLTFHGQQHLMNVMDAIRHCSYIYDIAHVIIDNVQFMIEVVPDSYNLDRFCKQDYMVQMFRSFASQNNCHVTLVMHPKKTDGVDLAINSIFGGVKATQEADNVLILQRKEGSGSAPSKYLQVVKNRFSGDLGSFYLNFDKPSLSFSEKGKVDMESTYIYTDEFEKQLKEPTKFRQKLRYPEWYN